jgi:regulator of protease activity HflC (stomatin/prohibitin superfamily)
MEHERILLTHDAEELRAFYSLTGPARKDYTEQMAEAEANRVRLLRQAQADGLVAMRRAEAEGYLMIGEALASLPNSRDVIEVAKLHTAQRIADYLSDGKATKMFLPQDMGSVFSLLGIGEDILKGSQNRSREVPDGPAMDD